MIKKVTVNNNFGESMTIKIAEPIINTGTITTVPPETGIFITEIEGLGPAKSDINMGEVATQHGSRFISSREKSRDITFHFLFFDINGATAEDARLVTYKYFPIGEKVTLTFETENRKAYTSGYVESNEPEIFAEQAGAVITVSCPEAWLRMSYPNDTLDYTMCNMYSAFEFEFEDPVEALPTGSLNFGEIELGKTHIINYPGEGTTSITITISCSESTDAPGVGGAFEMPKIYNLDTGEFMKIDTDVIEKLVNPNYVPPATEEEVDVRETCMDGCKIVISTATNNKYVRYYHNNGKTYNALNALTLDSTWLKLHPGNNKFAYECEQGDLFVDINIKASVFVSGV